MIAKITNGVRFTGLAVYLHGPGTANEHTYEDRVGGAVIGGNLGAEGAREGAAWAAMLREAASTRPDIDKPVWHVSLRNPPSDRTLSDGEWAMAGQGFAEKMGFEDKPWVMVRHGEDHVHLVASRVGFNGQVWSRSDDRYKAQRACTAIEADLGLAAAPRESSASSRRSADHQVSTGEWRRGLREHAAPGRVALATAVVHAAAASTGGGREAFEVALDRAGIDHQVNVASTGRVSGYRFHLPGHDDAAGAAVWFRASQLDKRLAWSNLGLVLEGPAPEPNPHLAPERKKLETKRHHRARAQKEEAAGRLARLPSAIERSGYDNLMWWHQRAVQRDAGIAARALARQREASEAHARALIKEMLNRPRPTLNPAAQAELARTLERSGHSPAWYRQHSPESGRGSSFER